MGCSNSSLDLESEESKKIDESLKQERKLLRNEVKLLLLGAGESGKSTVCKQMRLLYSEPYTEEERKNFTSVVCSNTLQSMQVVLNGTNSLQIPLPAHLEPIAQTILDTDSNSFDHSHGVGLDQETARGLFLLWRDPVIKSIVERGNELQLNDSAIYFFESIARISSLEYIPTEQDILRTRIRSIGIVEEKYIIGNSLLKIFDVGGQRNQRKKWIHCFAGVDVVLFVAAISEYDQMLWEDEDCNRLEESLQVFDSVVASRWFTRSSIILFLNKIDIFNKKLTINPLELYCQDYVGASEYEAQSYMKEKFLARTGIKREKIFTHLTCATDSTQAKIVLTAVTDTILKGNMTHVGMV